MTGTVRARAHGRVNLVGEHTDYNGGLVLPMAIAPAIAVEAAARTDGWVRVTSDRFPADGRLDYELDGETKRGGWIDYVQAATFALREARHEIYGADLAITSTLPPGAGLASSAALLVAVLRALAELSGLALGDRAIAALAHRAETGFVGAPVGVMDVMVASLTHELSGEAMLLDTRTLEVERAPFPADLELAVVDSGVRHAHSTGDYRTRREECARAATLLGVDTLCELDLDELVRKMGSLPPPLDRRARHVVSDSGRVRDMVRALRWRELARAGALLYASHASQRDDFDVSVPEVDRLVEAARADTDALGARLTGGGFGGAVMIFARAGTASEVAHRVASVVTSASVVLPR